MSHTLTIPPFSADSSALCPDLHAWRKAWIEAKDDPSGYWLQQTLDLLSWHTPPTIGLEGDFWSVHEQPLRWFSDGRLNVSWQCLDRHLESRADQTAIIWESDEPGEGSTLSYRALHEQVCRAANSLTHAGVNVGDRVLIYMGMTPHAAIAMLACARIGAIHSVVFGGFSAEAITDRLRDCNARFVITQDEARRGGKSTPLKAVVNEAINRLTPTEQASLDTVFVYRRTGGVIEWKDRDRDWEKLLSEAVAEHQPKAFEAEHPLFILYTSGSTGRPKGVVHTSGGYMTYTSYTHRLVFEVREGDVYACVADVGWITGHSYIIYGPLANGATTVMFESTPLYPDAGRYWDLVERHQVNIFYTAPTAIRALAAKDTAFVTQYDLSSLRVLGTVGEPINPEAWYWYHDVVGKGNCAIVDTWWQTETGGICIAPIAPVTPTKPGAATRPLPGIQPSLLTPEGRTLIGPNQGLLCIDYSWPGQARTVWGDHARFVETYFSAFSGRYFTGDGCRRDQDGYYWITGRVDDVINVSGHRMGTAEFESSLVTHEMVTEAAVVGFPHPIKGQGVCAYLILQKDLALDDTLQSALQKILRTQIGAHAKVDRFIHAEALPKTRSGKVMRRLLRKMAEGEFSELGDTSTLADPDAFERLRMTLKNNAQV